MGNELQISINEEITKEWFIANYDRIKSDATWRIFSGAFYRIMIKGDDDTEVFTLPFRPNEAQSDFLNNLYWRNLILKARQFGFTTLVAIIWLDHALFVADQRCGIIAHKREAAEVIFRDKVKFAYDNLPDFMRAMFPLARESSQELLFAHNNSSIRVDTSMRSGTIHRLHVSEMGKIAAEYPLRAREIITGSLPAVPMSGITIIESTAEGDDGAFYRMCDRALQHIDAGKKLNRRDFRLHFYGWWMHTDYRMDPEGVEISAADDQYFDEVEAETGIELDQEQCAWYVATRDNDYAGQPELMWQEYPSTPREAFKRSDEGRWYAVQMTAARKQGRICNLPTEVTVACWTFWDIGNTDGTAIWVVQLIGYEFRCIRFYEAWGEPYAHATAWLQNLNLTYEAHYLPHDAYHRRQGSFENKSPAIMLQELMPGANFIKVERIQDVTWGIQQTRDVFSMLYFDAVHCKEGIAHIDRYKKKWNSTQQRFTDEPEKADGHSEAADALRQMGQAHAAGLINYRARDSKKNRARSWRTA